MTEYDGVSHKLDLLGGPFRDRELSPIRMVVLPSRLPVPNPRSDNGGTLRALRDLSGADVFVDLHDR